MKLSVLAKFSFALIIFITLLIPFTQVEPVRAATGEWLDVASIKVGGTTYIDPQTGGSQHYYPNGGAGDCVNEISRPFDDNKKAILTVATKDPRNGNCSKKDEDISLSSPGNRAIWFHWVDADTIKTAFTKLELERAVTIDGGIYKRLSSGSQEFVDQNSGTCHSSVVLSGDTNGQFTPRFTQSGVGGGTCVDSSAKRGVGVGSVANKETPSTGTSGDTVDNDIQCAVDSGFSNSLLWLLCPAVEAALEFVDFAEKSIIVPYLSINPLDDTDGNSIFEIWKAVRNIANIFLVLVFFVIIFAQATSLNIEAYAVKRMLPRLLAAAIFTQISFYVAAFIIDIFNVLGAGVGSLVGTLVKGNAPLEITLGGGGTSTALFALGAGVLLKKIFTIKNAIAGGGGVGVALTPFVSLAVGAVIVILGVVLILVLRQIVIIGLVMIAPLAFIAWVLPNTESMFKSWFKLLTRALMMYPLIVGLFAAGKIFGTIITAMPEQGGFANGTVTSFMGFLSYVGPLALIPLTFKLASGVIGSAGAFLTKGRQNLQHKVSDPHSSLASWANRADEKRAEMKLSERARRLDEQDYTPTALQSGRGRWLGEKYNNARVKAARAAMRLSPGLSRAAYGARAESVEGAGKLIETLSNDDYALRDLAEHAHDTPKEYMDWLNNTGTHANVAPEDRVDPILRAKMLPFASVVGQPDTADIVVAAAERAALAGKLSTGENPTQYLEAVKRAYMYKDKAGNFQQEDGTWNWRGKESASRANLAIGRISALASKGGSVNLHKAGLDQDGYVSLSAKIDGGASPRRVLDNGTILEAKQGRGPNGILEHKISDDEAMARIVEGFGSGGITKIRPEAAEAMGKGAGFNIVRRVIKDENGVNPIKTQNVKKASFDFLANTAARAGYENLEVRSSIMNAIDRPGTQDEPSDFDTVYNPGDILPTGNPSTLAEPTTLRELIKGRIAQADAEEAARRAAARGQAELPPEDPAAGGIPPE